MIVVNTKHKRRTKDEGGEDQPVYVDYVLKKDDMIKLLKLYPKDEQKRERISKFFKGRALTKGIF